MLLPLQFALAQRTVSGVVTDAGTGEPLIGANVGVKGTVTGTTTNLEGDFTLRVPDNQVAGNGDGTGAGAAAPLVGDAEVAGGDYLLAVKGNQATLEPEIRSYFETAPEAELQTLTLLDKDHGRLETRTHRLAKKLDWLRGERHYPGEPRFPNLKAIAMVEAQIEKQGRTTRARRYYITSADLDPERLARAVRSHWAIENSLHWVLDVAFKEDLSRLRAGHGATNMAIVRHFALTLVRQAKDKRSIKTR